MDRLCLLRTPFKPGWLLVLTETPASYLHLIEQPSLRSFCLACCAPTHPPQTVEAIEETTLAEFAARKKRWAATRVHEWNSGRGAHRIPFNLY